MKTYPYTTPVYKYVIETNPVNRKFVGKIIDKSTRKVVLSTRDFDSRQEAEEYEEQTMIFFWGD